ncbi:hypothetical protein NEAUS03_0630 [Nematocida ausubeli]|nr:hypothetical protein NEAUS03_0630 [Nematocida ausubeli]
MNVFVVFCQSDLIFVLSVYMPINISILSTDIAILSFMCICLLFPFLLFLMSPCIFILVYIGKIKYTYGFITRFILLEYKKRNKTLEAGSRRKLAHSREPLLLRHQRKNRYLFTSIKTFSSIHCIVVCSLHYRGISKYFFLVPFGLYRDYFRFLPMDRSFLSRVLFLICLQLNIQLNTFSLYSC